MADRDDDFNLDELTDEQIETTARRQGWTSEEEWDEERAEKEGRRKPTRFYSAREYLERINGTMPALRGRLRKSDETIERLGGEIAGLTKQQKETAELIRNQAKMAAAANKAAYDRGIKDATERMSQAKTDSDFDAYEEAREEKARLEKAKEAVAEPEAGAGTEERRTPEKEKPKIDPETEAWVNRNSWFQDDEKLHLNATMISEHKKVKREEPDLGIIEALDEAKRRVILKFPEDFGKNPARDAAGAVRRPSGGDGVKPNSAKARFSALPASDQKEYERQRDLIKKSHKADYTIEEFLEAYET